jgi:hypothetical protein
MQCASHACLHHNEASHMLNINWDRALIQLCALAVDTGTCAGPLPVVSYASLQAAFRSSLNAIAVVRVTSEAAAQSSGGGEPTATTSGWHRHAAARRYSKAGSISLAGHKRLQQQHQEEELFHQLRSAATSHCGVRGGSQSARFFSSSDGGDDAAPGGQCRPASSCMDATSRICNCSVQLPGIAAPSGMSLHA